MQRQLFFIIFLFFFQSQSVAAQTKQQLDSINKYVSLSKNSEFSLEDRLTYALTSQKLAKVLKVDSVRLRVQRNLSLVYFYNDMFDEYIPLNRENFTLAKKLKDSVAITVAASNLGSYYRYTQQNDSSYLFYSKALEYFPKNEFSQEKATALLCTAEVQRLEKIYTGAEEDAVLAIAILDRLPKTEYRLDTYWSLYDLLARISEDLGNYEKAIEYYDTSIDYANQMEDGFINRVFSINNKADSYRELKNYDRAIELYESLLPLRSKYEDFDPIFYPAIIHNITKTKFETGNYSFDELELDYKKAYKIVKDLEDEIAIMSTSLDLSDFYLKFNYKDSVIKYGEQALKIGEQVSSNETRQRALINLSKVVEAEDSNKLLLDHINLTDSLAVARRTIRNNFARIKFDTDQLEAKNEQISKENIYLLILSMGLLFSGVLVYIVISQRAKNKELRLVQIQQKANEDIYNLMLGQQDKVDEARAKEKIRVSKELHDGVLGRLFGTRLSLDSMNFKDGKEAMMTRANYIGQLKTIEEDIRKISHELNTDFVSGTGFMNIVSELIENQSNAYGLKHDFKFTDDISWDLVSNKAKINIYRIIQESMQNIYKHANAKQIKISISRKKSLICIDVTDDGIGFDTSKSKNGIGLKNMTSRVNDIDGKISFSSEINKGTSVKVKIPYSV